SSRRRHTIFSRDWSSDVCSSDLETAPPHRTLKTAAADHTPPRAPLGGSPSSRPPNTPGAATPGLDDPRTDADSHAAHTIEDRRTAAWSDHARSPVSSDEMQL